MNHNYVVRVDDVPYMFEKEEQVLEFIKLILKHKATLDGITIRYALDSSR